MLVELADRYGSWSLHALFFEQCSDATIVWPGRPTYRCPIGVFVGPDSARWIWCSPPAGQLQFPLDPTTTIIQVSGVIADGRQFIARSCIPSNYSFQWSAGEQGNSNLLLRVQDRCIDLPTTHAVRGPFQVSWTFSNAIFTGSSTATFQSATVVEERLVTIPFRYMDREWTLSQLPSFRDEHQKALVNGLVKQLPTSELVVQLDEIGQLEDAEIAAYSISRLLSFATGSSVAGGRRRIIKGNQLIAETFYEWPLYGDASAVHFTSTILNDGQIGTSLTQFIQETLEHYMAQNADYALSQCIGYLELARCTPVIESQILHAILALETISYQLCLKVGQTPDQLATASIQSKMNTVRGRYRMSFIDRKFVETTRESIRNPLIHSGIIPALTIAEKAQWANELYALAFRILLFLLNYSGRWYDSSNGHRATQSPYVP